MHNVMELVQLPKHVYLLIFYMVIIKNYKVKKLFNKFPERLEFPNSQPYFKYTNGRFRTIAAKQRLHYVCTKNHSNKIDSMEDS